MGDQSISSLLGHTGWSCPTNQTSLCLLNSVIGLRETRRRAIQSKSVKHDNRWPCLSFDKLMWLELPVVSCGIEVVGLVLGADRVQGGRQRLGLPFSGRGRHPSSEALDVHLRFWHLNYFHLQKMERFKTGRCATEGFCACSLFKVSKRLNLGISRGGRVRLVRRRQQETHREGFPLPEVFTLSFHFHENGSRHLHFVI